MAVQARQGAKYIKVRKKPMYEEEVMDNVTEEVAEEVVYQDETLVCKECGNEFVFTVGEQKFYAEKGFTNKPKTCKACRDAKKNAGKPERQYFEAVCSECGNIAKLTFEPNPDRPVYCSDCFAARRRPRD